MKLRFSRAGAALLALALACSLLTVPASADVASVTVTPGEYTLAVDKGIQLSADVRMENDSEPVPTLTWSSQPPNVVSVSASGYVTVDQGQPGQTATVFAMAPNTKVGICRITLTDPQVAVGSVQMDTKYLEMTEGERATLTVTVLPEDASNKSVTYTSADPDIVSVTSGGQLVALKEGSTTVTATANDQSGKSDFCFVTVKKRVLDFSNIKVKLNEGATIPMGGTILLTATVEGAPEGVSTDLTWSSTNPGRIGWRYPDSNDTGTVELYLTNSTQPGDQSTIVASLVADKTKSAVCAVRVVSAPPSKITSVEITTAPNSNGRNYVDPGTGGTTLRLQATAYPASASEEDRRIVWTSGNPSVATVDPNTGVVTGHTPGEAVIRATANGDSEKFAERTVEVSGLLLSYVKKSATGGQGTTVELKENTEVEIFQHKDIAVSYKAFGNAQNKTINWESSNPTVAQVVDGRVTGNYPGSNVTISAAAAGTNCSSSFKVRVVEDVADAITVDMGSSPSYGLSGILSQLNARSQSKAGAPLDYVYSLKVSTKNGVLYYKYNTSELPGHGVGGTERYYYQPSGQQMGLRDVTFVPLAGFDGTAVVDYIGMATNGTSFTGTIRIEAEASGDVSYTTGAGQPVAFTADHFASICKGRTGKAIRYVTFTQPAASQGALYYNYSTSGQFSQKVNSATRYYASSSPSIDNITFVPAEGYTGTVTIPYHCVDSAGASFNGSVIIRVGSGGGSADSGSTVVYYTGVNQPRALRAGNFNDVSLRVVNSGLDRIRFQSLPSSSAGTLYLNYGKSTSSRATTSANYYRSISPSISDLTFVPDAGYTGTVSIPFTGTAVSGSTFKGTLTIHVGTESGGGTSSASGVYYSGSSLPIDFRAQDFQDVCRAALGNPLSYVQFRSMPAVGRLYQNYSASTRTGAVVNAVTHYGVQDLGQISYIPKAEYQGTLTIPYTMHDTAGGTASGAVTLQLSNSYCQATFADTASGWDWAKPSIEYLRDSGITSGYRNNTYRPGQSISRGEFTLMICRAFQFPTTGTSSFRDVPRNSTYAGAIASAKNLGIVQGNNGRFQPDRPITRQSAMTMICRAIRAAGQTLPDADTGLLSSYADGARVSAHARTSVAALIQMGAVRGNSASRLNPGAAISRAEMAVILHRVLTR